MFTPIPLSKSEKTGIGYWEGFSPKLKRDVTLLGDLEYDHWLFVETNPSISNYCERPTFIKVITNGKVYTSKPSLWVKYKDNSESLIKVIDIRMKHTKKIQDEIYIEEYWCKEKNMSHNVIHNLEIRSNQTLLSNNKLLISIVSNRPSPIDIDLHLISQFLSKERKHLYQIKERLIDRISEIRITEAICWLIFQGKVESNMDKVPIGPKLEVWKSE